jgi:hypothetical protein
MVEFVVALVPTRYAEGKLQLVPVNDPQRRGYGPNITRDELVARLIRAGELEVSGGDQAEIDSYFDPSKFRFHGPDGFEADYAGLTNYFKSIRAAFDDRSIRRGIIVALQLQQIQEDQRLLQQQQQH